MGKKVKKKARCGQKDKRVAATNPKTVPEEQKLSSEPVTDVASVAKERKGCLHLDKSMDLTKVSSKLELAEGFRCEDCREGAADRKGAKGKGKQGKKKGPDSKAIWVCLECGHFACGGVGLPTTNQSHAVRHSRLSGHLLVIQVEKPQLRWCFRCSSLITVDKFENGEQKDMLSDVVKLLKKPPSNGSSMDVEDVWFGSGSILNEMKSESSLSNGIRGRDFYAVRGLNNLGNTCFFNSVMQNLLAMDRFQDDLMKLDDSTGPLTNSLKKLYAEINSQSGVRNALNPKSLFGCVCSKAPQFRGYQQQDSHELLRYLLDGLSTEDLRVKKSTNYCPKPENTSHVSTSFVDVIFGGQLSSTVCCVECEHSSVVYEPFLDLSLPVPTKKPPPKKVPTVSRNRKTKPPPRKVGKTRPKPGKDGVSAPTDVTTGVKGDSVNGSSLACPTDCSDVVNGNGSFSVSVGISASAESKDTNISKAAQQAMSVDDFTWLDYAEPMSLEAEQDLGLLTKELPANQDSGRIDILQNGVTHQDFPEATPQDFPEATPQEIVVDGSARMDYLDSTSLADKQSWHLQSGEIPAIQDSGRTEMSLNDEIPQSLNSCSNERLLRHEEMNAKSNSYHNSFEDEEAPLLVGNSEVLLLPYTEETVAVENFMERDIEPSSSAVGGDDDMLGFEGFADMFNEPEVVSMGPHPKLDAGETGNSSESSPDEVDDSDSPVSIESCLSHFTKPELLADEHAWHCENCTKVMLEKRRKSRKKKPKPVSATQNGYCDNFSRLRVGESNQNNGTADSDKELQLTNGFVDASETSAICQTAEKVNMTENNASNSSEESTELAAADPANGNASELAEDGESGDSDVEEADSKSVKAMRNATKRILISKLPPILTIHLKRFNQDTRGRLSKLNGHVVFKELVDLRPYLDSRCPERKGDCKYRLVGLVEHLGSMRGGHYVAYVRGGDRRRGEEGQSNNNKSVWYYASDTHVRETTLEEVLRCEAYILFYEKV